jgi:hypothetical protein
MVRTQLHVFLKMRALLLSRRTLSSRGEFGSGPFLFPALMEKEKKRQRFGVTRMRIRGTKTTGHGTIRLLGAELLKQPGSRL